MAVRSARGLVAAPSVHRDQQAQMTHLADNLKSDQLGKEITMPAKRLYIMKLKCQWLVCQKGNREIGGSERHVAFV